VPLLDESAKAAEERCARPPRHQSGQSQILLRGARAERLQYQSCCYDRSADTMAKLAALFSEKWTVSLIRVRDGLRSLIPGGFYERFTFRTAYFIQQIGTSWRCCLMYGLALELERLQGTYSRIIQCWREKIHNRASLRMLAGSHQCRKSCVR